MNPQQPFDHQHHHPHHHQPHHHHPVSPPRPDTPPHNFRGTPGTLIVCPQDEHAFLKAVQTDNTNDESSSDIFSVLQRLQPQAPDATGGDGSSDDDEDEDEKNATFKCPGCSTSFFVRKTRFQDFSPIRSIFGKCSHCKIAWKVEKAGEEVENESTKPDNAFKCPQCSLGDIVNKAEETKEEETARKAMLDAQLAKLRQQYPDAEFPQQVLE